MCDNHFNFKNQLLIYRKEIDKIDDTILDALFKRFSIGYQIGQLKKKAHLPIEDKKRESKILNRIIKKISDKNKSSKFQIPVEHINIIYRIILEKVRSFQN